MRAASLAVGLVALLVAGEAAAQRLPFTWDIPKVVEEVEVPGIMRADGVPVKLRSVRSSERPEVIVNYLIDRFQAWGFYMPPAEHRVQLVKEPYLTALDTERLISYTFIIQPQSDGTTTVVLGEANLGQRKQLLSTLAPVFPGATDVMNTDLEVARSVSYVVKAKQEEVEAFYRKELTRVGYAEVEPNRYQVDGDEVQVLFRPAEKGPLSVVVLRRASAAEETHKPEAD